jgi:inosine-uridine nucleoside N-ribohydrolase
MARKVIIDCDPGIDDAVALCLALFDPRLDVLAVTAVEGNVPAEQASRNVQTVIEQLDPPRYPRLGTAAQVENAPHTDMRRLHGDDGLGNAGFAVSQLHHQHPSEKVICDEIRAAPDQVSLLCLGPLTNVAHAFKRDPELPQLVHHVIISGGSLNGIGDVTPAAEFDMFYDPVSAQAVFRAPATKTLIPLDVTRQVALTLDFVDQLPAESTRAGRLLRRMVTYAFRAHRQHLGLESILFQGVVALAATLHPELFDTEELTGDVETAGQLTKGATIFDRRPNAPRQSNMAVALNADADAVKDCILRGLAEAGRCT